MMVDVGVLRHVGHFAPRRQSTKCRFLTEESALRRIGLIPFGTDLFVGYAAHSTRPTWTGLYKEAISTTNRRSLLCNCDLVQQGEMARLAKCDLLRP
jgi:hypothetical protein